MQNTTCERCKKSSRYAYSVGEEYAPDTPSKMRSVGRATPRAGFRWLSHSVMVSPGAAGRRTIARADSDECLKPVISERSERLPLKTIHAAFPVSAAGRLGASSACGADALNCVAMLSSARWMTGARRASICSVARMDKSWKD
eukprot:scaffold257349_cov36-Tisochrysis_lutea.AAC.2